MNPERWRQIDDLFDAAIRVAPSSREEWLRARCNGDDALRAEVARMLVLDERAATDGFLPPPALAAVEQTGSWTRCQDRTLSSPPETKPINPVISPALPADGFSPKAAIARDGASDRAAVVQARLRELAVIDILILAILLFWMHAVLGDDDITVHIASSAVILTLGAITALLSSNREISPAWLRTTDLGMITLMASLITFIQYHMMLIYSRRYDSMLAQLTMKNVVLLTAILILTYGLYVPRSWRRAGVVAAVLAMLPFATMLILAALHPAAMEWLGRGWKRSDTARLLLFSFDAMILGIVAIGATIGARAISQLRGQVAAARQLGQYRLGQRLGAGGMGDVYLAEHQLLKRPCAIKLIRSGCEANSRAQERFEREVRITATLSHPNTVEIYDYGRTEDGTYYYVMELLRGLSFAELVEKHGPLPAGRAIYLLRQICQALREAHAVGLIHRDIKPSNVFAAERGGMEDVAKLLDFGLVRRSATTDKLDLSDEGQIMGTPLFMSPEQARDSQELDERSDIYSLGAVAYFLLTGRPPFNHQDSIAVIIAHARDPVIAPSLIQPGVPEDLERVVIQCLAKEPADRFTDAGTMERALASCEAAGEWDQERAAAWWSSNDQAHAGGNRSRREFAGVS